MDVLIIDPSAFARACTVAGLEAAAGLAIEAGPSINAIDRAIPPDLILFQTAERRFTGSPLARQLALAARRWPDTPALIVADFFDTGEMVATIRAGAQGFLPSSASIDSMRSAIRLLVEGIAVYPAWLTTALRSGPVAAELPVAPRAAQAAVASNRMTMLTRRQQQVLQLLALGSSNKTIAQHLQISESTVKVHIRAIMTRNDVSNRTQLVAHFLKGNGADA